MIDSIDRVRVRVLPDGRLTARDAAAYLGLKEKTLANMRSHGHGPKPTRVGGRIFYFQEDLDSFIGAKPAISQDTALEASTT